MAKSGINKKILNGIRNVGKDYGSVVEFLKEILYKEAEHQGRWKWKNEYKKKIEKYVKDWENINED